MKLTRMPLILCIVGTLGLSPATSRADFFGGDLPLLSAILAQAIQQLAQLRALMGNGKDTLGFLELINEGIRQAMDIMRTMNTTIQPGIYSNYQNVNDLMNQLQSLYGTVSDTFDSKLERSQDQSVSEAITLHNQAFQYATQLDPEVEKIKDYARVVSPQGAAKLTAQSLGVLIHVSNQILRTNAAMLKIMSENLALQNRHEKMSSRAFKTTYESVSKNLNSLAPMQTSTDLNKR